MIPPGCATRLALAPDLGKVGGENFVSRACEVLL